MLRNLRRVETQARLAMLLAILAAPLGASAAGLALRNYEPVLGQIVYGSSGLFLPAFLGCALLGLGLGTAAFALGWSSILRPRNERPGSSWTGFFLGGLTATACLILLIAFFMIRLEQPT